MGILRNTGSGFLRFKHARKLEAEIKASIEELRKSAPEQPEQSEDKTSTEDKISERRRLRQQQLASYDLPDLKVALARHPADLSAILSELGAARIDLTSVIEAQTSSLQRTLGALEELYLTSVLPADEYQRLLGFVENVLPHPGLPEDFRAVSPRKSEEHIEDQKPG